MWKHEYLLELVGVVGACYHVVVLVYIGLNEGQAISIMATPSVEYEERTTLSWIDIGHIN